MDNSERAPLEGGLLCCPRERSLSVLGSVDTDDDGSRNDRFILHVPRLVASEAG